MFRLWVKLMKENHILKENVYEDPSDKNRTKKIFLGIEESVRKWDLGSPVWLPANIDDFKAHSKCRFYQDNFMEEIAFDFMEIQVIEE